MHDGWRLGVKWGGVGWGWGESEEGLTGKWKVIRKKDQRLGAEQDQLPCGPTGVSFDS